MTPDLDALKEKVTHLSLIKQLAPEVKSIVEATKLQEDQNKLELAGLTAVERVGVV